MNGLRRLANEVSTVSRREILQSARQILLTNVPRTATPDDIRREITKAGVRGVSDIALDYEYFKPTERAILTLVDRDYLRPSLLALKNLTISGVPISSDAYVAEIQQRPRARGFDGRVEAADRGALDGHGPNAGIPNNELTVTISGFPARMKVTNVEDLLKDYHVAQARKGLPLIIKLPLPPKAFSMTSRFIVILTSVTEAHRLVRNLHASSMSIYGQECLLSAKIIH